MLLHKIVHSCSNVHVAGAAVMSIDNDFASSFSVEASHRNMSAGEFAALVIKEFSAKASSEELDGLVEAARQSDQPILSGLRYILSRIFSMSVTGPLTPSFDDRDLAGMN